MLGIILLGVILGASIIGYRVILGPKAFESGWVLMGTAYGGNLAWQYNCYDCQEGGYAGEVDARNIPGDGAGKQGQPGAGIMLPEQGANRYYCKANPTDPNNPFSDPSTPWNDWFRNGCQTGSPGFVRVDQNTGAVDYSWCGMQQIDRSVNGQRKSYSYFDQRPEVCQPAVSCPVCPPEFANSLSPANGTALTPGQHNITWAALGAAGYAVRVEDLNNGDQSHADQCTTTPGQPGMDGAGDECFDAFNIGDTAWSFNFEDGHTYDIWVELRKGAGQESCDTCRTSSRVTSQAEAPPPPPPDVPTSTPTPTTPPGVPTSTPTPTPTRTPTPTPTLPPGVTPTATPTLPPGVTPTPTNVLLAQATVVPTLPPGVTATPPAPEAGSPVLFMFGLVGILLIFSVLFL